MGGGGGGGEGGRQKVGTVGFEPGILDCKVAQKPLYKMLNQYCASINGSMDCST